MSLEGYSSCELSRERREIIEREQRARLEAERKRQEEELRKQEGLRKQQGRDRVAYAFKQTRLPRHPQIQSISDPGLRTTCAFNAVTIWSGASGKNFKLVAELQRVIADIAAPIETRVRPVITIAQAYLEQASRELPTNGTYHMGKLRSVRYQIVDAIESAARAQTVEDDRYLADRREMVLEARSLADIAVLDDDLAAALRIAEQLETHIGLELAPVRRHLADLSGEIKEAQMNAFERDHFEGKPLPCRPCSFRARLVHAGRIILSRRNSMRHNRSMETLVLRNGKLSLTHTRWRMEYPAVENNY